VDSCPYGAGDDVDGDNLCSNVDSCLFDAENDADGDSICGNIDGCPYDDENDWDADGFCGDVDSCPFDAENDIDLDGLCAEIDTCRYDAENDIDSDLICGSIDSCPLDDENDIDSDLICGDKDSCAYDNLNDVDSDFMCSDADMCPMDALNDQDSDNICGQSVCVDSIFVGEHGSCATYEVGRSNHGHCVDDDMCSYCACACGIECHTVDVCPHDSENDADGDDLCSTIDPCEYDAENDADSDNICGHIDNCPYDVLNDVDSDQVCGDIDVCPFSVDNDFDCDVKAQLTINLTASALCVNLSYTDDIVALVTAEVSASDALQSLTPFTLYLEQIHSSEASSIIMTFVVVSVENIEVTTLDFSQLTPKIDEILAVNSSCSSSDIGVVVSYADLLESSSDLALFASSTTTSLPQQQAQIVNEIESDNEAMDWTLIIIIISIVVLLLIIAVIVLVVIVTKKRKNDKKKIAPTTSSSSMKTGIEIDENMSKLDEGLDNRKRSNGNLSMSGSAIDPNYERKAVRMSLGLHGKRTAAPDSSAANRIDSAVLETGQLDDGDIGPVAARRRVRRKIRAERKGNMSTAADSALIDNIGDLNEIPVSRAARISASERQAIAIKRQAVAGTRNGNAAVSNSIPIMSAGPSKSRARRRRARVARQRNIGGNVINETNDSAKDDADSGKNSDVDGVVAVAPLRLGKRRSVRKARRFSKLKSLSNVVQISTNIKATRSRSRRRRRRDNLDQTVESETEGDQHVTGTDPKLKEQVPGQVTSKANVNASQADVDTLEQWFFEEKNPNDDDKGSENGVGEKASANQPFVRHKTRVKEKRVRRTRTKPRIAKVMPELQDL
jgi:hypothetical protein